MTSDQQVEFLRRLERLIVLPRPLVSAAEPSGDALRAAAPAALAGRPELVAALSRALAGERERGRAGHWSFDLNRCLALEQALAEARGEPAAMRSGSEPDGTPGRGQKKGRGA